MCARECLCSFLKMKQVFCCSHLSAVAAEDVRQSFAYGDCSSVIVDMNPDKAYKRVVTSLQPMRTTLRIGETLCVLGVEVLGGWVFVVLSCVHSSSCASLFACTLSLLHLHFPLHCSHPHLPSLSFLTPHLPHSPPHFPSLSPLTSLHSHPSLLTSLHSHSLQPLPSLSLLTTTPFHTHSHPTSRLHAS